MTDTTRKHLVKIEEYTLAEFCFKLQEFVQKGYKIVDTNEGYPKNFIGLYECQVATDWPNVTALQENKTDELVYQTATEVQTQEESVGKRPGRKPKA